MEKAVDPLYKFKAFSDKNFIDSYQKKWGCSKKLFTPNTENKATFDSHSTLSELDQRKVNAILDRNIRIYHKYAEEKLR